MRKSTFLVEIGTEELPPKILKKLGQDFFIKIVDEFKKNNIAYETIKWFASSCRLAVQSVIFIKSDCHNNKIDCINNCTNIKKNLKEKISTYYINTEMSAVFMNESLNQDATWLNWQKKSEFDLDVVDDCNIHGILYRVVYNVLQSFTNYEMMRWGDLDISFVRPVRNITMLLDKHIIEGCIFGINIDRIVYGHQCMEDNLIILDHADSYADVLMQKGYVIADYGKRKKIISLSIEKEAKKLGGIVSFYNSKLIEEVVSLVEWPVVLSGKFDKRFLQLPSEVILHIMKYDQKYFPVYHFDDGTLLSCFIFVANVISDEYQSIIFGHERVIGQRLLDAEFFFKNDSRFRLEDSINKLDCVLFHSTLGTLRDKSLRIEALSGWIACQIGVDVLQSKRAGYLCKCDLISDMVYEFPSAQGIIGMYYAYRDGESQEVAIAQKEYYKPYFARDTLPMGKISCVVSIADKMDTIAGIFGIKEFPKGSRDPFALKRSILGVLRILMEQKFFLNLSDLVQKSVKLYGSKLFNERVIEDICDFAYKRLYSWYNMKGYKINIIRSAFQVNADCIADLDIRIFAMHNFFTSKRENGQKLCIIYKRILNILLQQKIPMIIIDHDVEMVLLKVPEEIFLFQKFILVKQKLQVFFAEKNYYDALVSLATLFDPTDKFFSTVIVVDSDKNIYFNRLVLLNKIKELFLKIADFSYF